MVWLRVTEPDGSTWEYGIPTEERVFCLVRDFHRFGDNVEIISYDA